MVQAASQAVGTTPEWVHAFHVLMDAVYFNNRFLEGLSVMPQGEAVQLKGPETDHTGVGMGVVCLMLFSPSRRTVSSYGFVVLGWHMSSEETLRSQFLRPSAVLDGSMLRAIPSGGQRAVALEFPLERGVPVPLWELLEECQSAMNCNQNRPSVVAVQYLTLCLAFCKWKGDVPGTIALFLVGKGAVRELAEPWAHTLQERYGDREQALAMRKVIPKLVEAAIERDSGHT